MSMTEERRQEHIENAVAIGILREAAENFYPPELVNQGETRLSTLDNAKKDTVIKRNVVKVERHTGPFLIPDTLSLEEAIKVIQARIDYEQQDVLINAEIDAPFVFESAYALYAELTERYGWANVVDTPGFFGPKPPEMLSVPVGPNERVQVPWGRFTLPHVKDGFLQSGITQKADGKAVFVIGGKVKRKDEAEVNEIAAAVQRRVREHSIYRGTAFRIKLFDEDGNRLPMPEPSFIELDERVEAELILPERTARSVGANIFTPIERMASVRKHGIPLKRGVLLAGPFGTGKTMVAHVTALKAVRNGWTYIVADDPRELSEVMRLAREYGPAVLFTEDVDRVMRGDGRSIDMDEILNVIDGVESKGTSLMVVLTTNEIDKITTAMLRPGRLDAVIHIGPPDADAAERLARQYARGLIAEDEPLTHSKKALAGNIPAVIREATERSKLYAIMDSATDDEELHVTDTSLGDAVTEMHDHVALLTPKEIDARSETVKAAHVLAEAMKETGAPPIFPVRPTGGASPDGTHRVPAAVRAETRTDDLPAAN